jgi:hypothetical protein
MKGSGVDAQAATYANAFFVKTFAGRYVHSAGLVSRLGMAIASDN